MKSKFSVERLLAEMELLSKAKTSNQPFHVVFLHESNVKVIASVVRMHIMRAAWRELEVQS